MLSERIPRPTRASAAAGSPAISPQTDSSMPVAPAASTEIRTRRRSAGWRESRYRSSAGLPRSTASVYCEGPAPQVDLAADDRDPAARHPAEVQTMLLEPVLRLAHVASDRRSGDAETLLEGLGSKRVGRGDQERQQDPSTSIGGIEDGRTGRSIERRQQARACRRAPLHPDPDPGLPSEAKTVLREDAVDRGKVVADHAIGQVQLGREGVDACRAHGLEQAPRDPGLAAVER